jgi:hypothetical protein
MRVSRLMLVTLRDDPAEAEIPSHRLLLRGGYIRRVAPGIYAYLPLMWRVLRKVSQVVREEMDRRRGPGNPAAPAAARRTLAAQRPLGGLHGRRGNHVPPGGPPGQGAGPGPHP